MNRRNPEADLVVQIVSDPDAADQQVTVVADQVLVATPDDVGKVVTVAEDGTLTLAEPTGGGGGVSIDSDAGDQAYRIKANTTVVAISGNEGRVTFPEPFPTGTVCVVAENGDTNAVAAGGSSHIGVEQFDATGFTVRWGLSSGTVRVNYIAVGY